MDGNSIDTILSKLYTNENLVLEEFTCTVRKASTADHVAELLTRCQTLRTLNLPLSEFTGTTSFVQIADALAVNQSVTTLTINNGAIETEGFVALANALRTNQTLTTLELVNANLFHIMPLDSMSIGELAETLRMNQTLHTLDLSFCRISDTDMVTLANAWSDNTSLTSLTLDGNSIKEDGVIALGDMLARNHTLEYLSLRSMTIGAMLGHLAAGLEANTSLRTLDLANTSCETANDNIHMSMTALFDTLRVNKTLETLNVSECELLSTSASTIAMFLAGNPSLRVLNLSGNLLNRDDNGCRWIISSLLFNTTLEVLQMNECGMTADDLSRMGRVLRENSVLTTLEVDRNKTDTMDPWVKLIESLQGNSSVTMISMQKCGITDESLPALRETLLNNTTLAEINMESNMFSEEGISFLHELDNSVQAELFFSIDNSAVA